MQEKAEGRFVTMCVSVSVSVSVCLSVCPSFYERISLFINHVLHVIMVYVYNICYCFM